MKKATFQTDLEVQTWPNSNALRNQGRAASPDWGRCIMFTIKQSRFLMEYESLCIKHGMFIGSACGRDGILTETPLKNPILACTCDGEDIQMVDLTTVEEERGIVAYGDEINIDHSDVYIDAVFMWDIRELLGEWLSIADHS